MARKIVTVDNTTNELPNSTTIAEGSDLENQVKSLVSEGTSGKADTTHNHSVSDVTGLQSALDSKQPAGDYASSGDLDGKANVSHQHSFEDLVDYEDFAEGLSQIFDRLDNLDRRMLSLEADKNPI